MSRARTINVHDVFSVEGFTHDAGLVLIIGSRKHRVRIHIQDYLAGAFGKELNKCLDERERVIKHARARLRGEA